MADRDDNPFDPDGRTARLLLGFADGELSETETAQLDAALAQSEELQELFISACLQNQFLPRVLETEVAKTREDRPVNPFIPLITRPESALPGTFGYFSFSSGWPVAYLVATVVMAVGLLVCSVVSVSQPEKVAKQSVLRSTSGKGAGGEGRDDVARSRPIVGRITGMVDCQWVANPKSEIRNPKSLIALGERFDLASGLVEITYDTGAKVVLQGPVTYEVESKDGGYLALGKLTARVDKGLEIRDKSSEIPHPSSLIPHPLFAVRTPTTTVTDLGTEFGVEVHSSGATLTHVFRGVVELRPAGDARDGQAVRLIANESAQVEPDGDQHLTVRRGKAAPSTFVRVEQLSRLAAESRRKHKNNPFATWQAYSRQLRRDPTLLAYYDFQPTEARPNVLSNVAGDPSLDGRIEGATWTEGHLPGKRALQFSGPSDYVCLRVPRTVDNLTLAAWIYAEPFANSLNGLLMSDGWDKTGRIHFQVIRNGQVGFDACDSTGRSTGFGPWPVFDPERLHRWTHLAVVYDREGTCVKCYADGHPLGQAAVDKPVPLCIGPARIGQWDCGGYVRNEKVRNFRGRIDELAIFGRVLSWNEIRRMVEAGGPPSSRTGP